MPTTEEIEKQESASTNMTRWAVSVTTTDGTPSQVSRHLVAVVSTSRESGRQTTLNYDADTFNLDGSVGFGSSLNYWTLADITK